MRLSRTTSRVQVEGLRLKCRVAQQFAPEAGARARAMHAASTLDDIKRALSSVEQEESVLFVRSMIPQDSTGNEVDLEFREGRKI